MVALTIAPALSPIAALSPQAPARAVPAAALALLRRARRSSAGLIAIVTASVVSPSTTSSSTRRLERRRRHHRTVLEDKPFNLSLDRSRGPHQSSLARFLAGPRPLATPRRACSAGVGAHHGARPGGRAPRTSSSGTARRSGSGSCERFHAGVCGPAIELAGQRAWDGARRLRARDCADRRDRRRPDRDRPLAPRRPGGLLARGADLPRRVRPVRRSDSISGPRSRCSWRSPTRAG